MTKKYELTDVKKFFLNRTLYQIKALRSFSNVMEGDLGGWIEKEENLSHDGDCWVTGEARVYGNARVYVNARVYDDAEVYGKAEVYGNAEVYGRALVNDNALVRGYAEVFGNAHVYGEAFVHGHAHICGETRACDYTQFCGDALVTSDDDFCAMAGFGSAYRTTTAYRTKAGGIGISCGCFYGTLDEFRLQVEKTHGDNKFGREYQAMIQLIKVKFEVE